MASNYTVYENLYNYMNYLLNGVQIPSSGSSISGNSSYNKVSDSKSFADTLRSAAGVTGVPQSMDSIFEEAAKLYNVPVQLLKAVGKAESGFNANAVSAVGAQGVMQLMPETARSLGVDDPFDARSNIMGGAKYIAEKLQQYDGDIELALAAYNAGSGNVAKYGGVPPFTETINYIERIKGYMGMDLTTGQTVQAGTAQQSSGIKNDGMNEPAEMSLSDVMSQYYMAQVQLKLQERINDLGDALSVTGASDGNDRQEDDENEQNYFL